MPICNTALTTPSLPAAAGLHEAQPCRYVTRHWPHLITGSRRPAWSTAMPICNTALNTPSLPAAAGLREAQPCRYVAWHWPHRHYRQPQACVKHSHADTWHGTDHTVITGSRRPAWSTAMPIRGMALTTPSLPAAAGLHEAQPCRYVAWHWPHRHYRQPQACVKHSHADMWHGTDHTVITGSRRPAWSTAMQICNTALTTPSLPAAAGLHEAQPCRYCFYSVVQKWVILPHRVDTLPR